MTGIGFCGECANFRKAPIVFKGTQTHVEERDCVLFKQKGYEGTGAYVAKDSILPCENFTPRGRQTMEEE